jgi:hypothetical protein
MHTGNGQGVSKRIVKKRQMRRRHKGAFLFGRSHDRITRLSHLIWLVRSGSFLYGGSLRTM